MSLHDLFSSEYWPTSSLLVASTISGLISIFKESQKWKKVFSGLTICFLLGSAYLGFIELLNKIEKDKISSYKREVEYKNIVEKLNSNLREVTSIMQSTKSILGKSDSLINGSFEINSGVKRIISPLFPLSVFINLHIPFEDERIVKLVRNVYQLKNRFDTVSDKNIKIDQFRATYSIGDKVMSIYCDDYNTIQELFKVQNVPQLYNRSYDFRLINGPVKKDQIKIMEDYSIKYPFARFRISRENIFASRLVVDFETKSVGLEEEYRDITDIKGSYQNKSFFGYEDLKGSTVIIKTLNYCNFISKVGFIPEMGLRKECFFRLSNEDLLTIKERQIFSDSIAHQFRSRIRNKLIYFHKIIQADFE